MRLTRPGDGSSVGDAAITAATRYALALGGLSAIVHATARSTDRSIEAMNIFLLTEALVSDVRAPGGRLDGVGAGGPIVLGTCGASCPLPADALRGALVEALLRDYLPSAANAAGITFGDIAEFALRLRDGGGSALFDGAPSDEFDKTPPELALLPSRVFSAQVSALPSVSLRAPRPTNNGSSATLSEPRFTGGWQWVTAENATLPDPG